AGPRSSGAPSAPARRSGWEAGTSSRAARRPARPYRRAPTAAARSSSAWRCAPARPSRSAPSERADRVDAATPRPLAIPARTLLRAMDAIRVTVWRGETAEAIHTVHAVSTAGDRIGDAGLVCYFRSSMKPLQAIPLREVHDDR